ncbi:MAG: M23 family metallopeptidase [Patescibacteria group bacterium]
MPTLNIDKGKVSSSSPSSTNGDMVNGGNFKASENTSSMPNIPKSSIDGNFSVSPNAKVTIDGQRVDPSNISNSAQSSDSVANNITPFNRNSDISSNASQLNYDNGLDLDSIQSLNNDPNIQSYSAGKGTPSPFTPQNNIKPFQRSATPKNLVENKPISSIPTPSNRLTAENPTYSDSTKKPENSNNQTPKTQGGGSGTPPKPPSGGGGWRGGNGNSEDEFDKKYKQIAFLANIWAFMINFLALMISTVLILSIFFGLGIVFIEMTCGAIANARTQFFGLGGMFVDKLPDEVKELCTNYEKIKGGCLSPAEAVENTKDVALKVDKSGLQEKECIGKNMDDTNDEVTLYGASGNARVKKEIVKQIIKYGKEAGVTQEVIKFTIAMQPLLTLQNAFRENSIGGCYGILQMCDQVGSSDRRTSQNYGEAVAGLNVNNVGDFLKSEVVQMKAVQNLFDKRDKDPALKDIKCLEEKFRGKPKIFKIAYVFGEVRCDGESPAPALNKEDFAFRVDKNYNAVNCSDFNSVMTKIVSSGELLKKLAYTENPAEIIFDKSSINTNPFGFDSKAASSFHSLGKDECIELQRYKPYIEEASKRYSNNLLPISPQLIGGILSRESHVGLLIGGCKGYGDYGNGHGLGQADPTSGDGLTGRNSATGLKLTKKTKDIQRTVTAEPKINKQYENDSFIWSECKDGILYLAAHLVEKQFYSHNFVVGALKGAGFNMGVDGSGAFSDIKTKKAYVQMVVNSYNAGQGGIQRASCAPDGSTKTARDGCTANGDYGTNVFRLASEAGKCMGYSTEESGILSAEITGGSGVNLACETDSNTDTANAAGSNFPLVSKKGIKIIWTQPFPQYLSGGGHNGIDIGPVPEDPSTTRVVAVENGTIQDDGIFYSTSCTSTCARKNQRYLTLKADSGKIYKYVHLDTTKEKKFKTTGDKVKTGDVLGQIDHFMFVHLHYSVMVNGNYVQPVDHIQGFPKSMKPISGAVNETNTFPASLTEKLL